MRAPCVHGLRVRDLRMRDLRMQDLRVRWALPGGYTGRRRPLRYRRPEDGPLRRRRECAPVGVAALRDRGQQVHFGAYAPGPGDAPQGGGQRVVPDEGGRPGEPSAGQPVGDPYGLYGDPRVQGRLERGPPEGPLAAAAPGAALGEDGDPVPGPQRPGDGVHGPGQGPDPVAFDEEGARLGGEPAEHRPGADLALGQHPAGQGGGDERDVGPGDVVGDDQAGPVRPGRAAHGDPQPQGPQERGAPGPDQRTPGPDGQQPHRRGGRDGQQDQRQGAGEPQHRVREARRPARVAGAVPRGAGGRGQQPVAHADGASERKWLR
ncbi:hypothetical protein GCM10010302_24620 [Streptomyces polychromogenes]|uniref:Uncharacterized protein n=1 Tax=Streptomyces polychromogenes TaxID=67342 RepID=A0ABN0VC44_9ACTN